MGKLLRFPKRTEARSPDEMWNWLRYGIDRGWVSEPVCGAHDCVPMTSDEKLDRQGGHDPCVYIVRLWEKD